MKLAVVGQPGAWSTERLAEALRAAGADASVVDLAACSLRLPDCRLFHRGAPLEGLDGAVVKKLGDTADGWASRSGSACCATWRPRASRSLIVCCPGSPPAPSTLSPKIYPAVIVP